MGIKCPMCDSEQIQAFQKGFGIGKALTGGILLGPIGLLAGGIGSKNVYLQCLNCGHKWEPMLETMSFEENKVNNSQKIGERSVFNIYISLNENYDISMVRDLLGTPKDIRKKILECNINDNEYKYEVDVLEYNYGDISDINFPSINIVFNSETKFIVQKHFMYLNINETLKQFDTVGLEIGQKVEVHSLLVKYGIPFSIYVDYGNVEQNIATNSLTWSSQNFNLDIVLNNGIIASFKLSEKNLSEQTQKKENIFKENKNGTTKIIFILNIILSIFIPFYGILATIYFVSKKRKKYTWIVPLILSLIFSISVLNTIISSSKTQNSISKSSNNLNIKNTK